VVRGQDKDSLEVIKLSLLRNLTPKPVQKTEKKRKKKKGTCNSSKNPKATQDEIKPLRCWGNEMVIVYRSTALLKEIGVIL
jgi:hypothetical protein